ncbi:hypothetical protein A5844_002656 [Enterococcus sp. 10A9_DIV0425]|uniref:Prepilin peptidase A24 N-terminal domain-containing protein n=1 Tax=Candidatus Enterococcus wittei TaxID=1987383 RepID=A0A242JWR3_9ENTE|nr:A24 family peptidase [Enterococcus sp. 10A9_DIV0425]OTP06950.1 hypothetical protein A5844_002656 [Enterococcus sp. 10A9_DIV0425]THE07435.1 prepilin peptidase [Enterococcus hirae]
MLIYFIIGCCIGSFLCLIAQRIPQGHSIISPRSHCVNCKKVLCWYELLPLISIAMQRFRCRHCHARLSWIYPIAELTGGSLVMYVEIYFKQNKWFLLLWLLCSLMFSLMDVLYFSIDAHLLYLSWGLLWIIWLMTGNFHWKSSLVVSLIGFLALHYGQIYLGAGDSLLLISWSGGLALDQILHVIFIASLFALIFFFSTFILFQKKIEKLPFVPFLSTALWLVLHFS